MSEIQFITTSDGSHSLLNTSIGETYHSRHGAVQESKYVFLKRGLDYFIEQNSPEKIAILEIGFGTGLNAWLTFEHLQSSLATIQYTSLETFPLPETIWQSLNYATSDIEKNSFKKLHTTAWNQAVQLTNQFTLQKVKTRLQDLNTNQKFDIIYFDAFAPNKQPEMWELSVLKKVTDYLSVNGVFITYCAKGQLKRDLKSLGLQVETLAGPPGKKEMVRAVKK
jgi:tRNA U34 5-methylaminomethyl-2-thiouridine-forming methyltransferase MnmC